MSPRKKENTERVVFFVSEDALTELKDEALEKGLSLSTLVRMIVLQHLAKKKEHNG